MRHVMGPKLHGDEPGPVFGNRRIDDVIAVRILGAVHIAGQVAADLVLETVDIRRKRRQRSQVLLKDTAGGLNIAPVFAPLPEPQIILCRRNVDTRCG